MRLIDADALKANIDNWYALVNEWGQTRITLSHKDIINKIDNQPTVDITIPLAEQEDSEDKIIRRTLENFMRGLWEEIQVGELEYTTSEVYEMLEREIFTDNHVGIPSAELKWIPINEKLPDDGEDVLFCDLFGDIMLGYHPRDWKSTHFAERGSWELQKNVAAWMPLPKPYREDGDLYELPPVTPNEEEMSIKYIEGYNAGFCHAQAIFQKEPKIGHCKDCKHFRKLPYHAGAIGKCVQHWGFCPPSDWYCADFEPQERSGEEGGEE